MIPTLVYALLRVLLDQVQQSDMSSNDATTGGNIAIAIGKQIDFVYPCIVDAWLVVRKFDLQAEKLVTLLIDWRHGFRNLQCP